jgi:hypothetical protein
MFIADGSGELWASVNPGRGVHMAHPGQRIPNLPPQVAEHLAVKGEPFDVQSEDEYVAERFYVDPTGRGVTIFARLPEDE